MEKKASSFVVSTPLRFIKGAQMEEFPYGYYLDPRFINAIRIDIEEEENNAE